MFSGPPSVEAFARICVSGFLFDPEVSLFRSPLHPNPERYPERYPTTPLAPPHSAAVARSGSLAYGPHRNNSFSKRLSKLSSTLLRPFALAPAARSPYPRMPPTSAVTLTGDAPADKIMYPGQRTQANSTFFSNILRSDKSDEISLPFQLSMNNIRDKSRRNLPYLRQSWTRIDFIAIVSFWIMFALAMAGIERGTQHIGLFRALSVIRTARLLSITAGTTVSVYRVIWCFVCLLRRVDYHAFFENSTTTPYQSCIFCPFCDGAVFVRAFPLASLPSYSCISFSRVIGIQSFKGSLRRTCNLVPTLGENMTQIPTQFCGGHIDPATHRSTGYITLDGRVSGSSKGYICPLGQLCLVGSWSPKFCTRQPFTSLLLGTTEPI